MARAFPAPTLVPTPYPSCSRSSTGHMAPWNQSEKKGSSTLTCNCGPGLLAAAALFLSTSFSSPPPPPPPPPLDTLENVPRTLSQSDGRAARIQHPKSRKAESCVGKCVTRCIQGGAGSPGEGPLNARRPLVVFKPGFRSRQYCLIECSDICNLIKDGDDGP